MSGIYSNKFKVENSDVSRIIFIDERTKLGDLPASQATAAEIVMTRENALALGKLLVRLIKET